MMRKLIFGAFILLLASCSKSVETLDSPQENPKDTTAPIASFREYIIKSGEHYSNHNPFTPFVKQKIQFQVKFDSTAIYTLSNPSNQADINKLYGFADNNSQHHEFSARFGWRYYNQQLSLHAYIYNQSVRSTKQLAVIQLQQVYDCSITVTPDTYIFNLNGVNTVMPRLSKTPVASGYKLYPYFGGDEAAPHDIRIFIKETE